MDLTEKRLRLNLLVKESSSIEQFLQRVVEKMARLFNAQVCSIYLYKKQKQKLTLAANYGLNPRFINRLHIPLKTGLVGKVMDELQPIIDNNGSQRKEFLPIKNLGEEDYNAYLVVPLVHYQEKIGVFSMQRTEKKSFTKSDLTKVETILKSIVHLLEEAHALIEFREIKEKKSTTTHKSHTFDISGRIICKSSAPYIEGPATWIDQEKNIEQSLMFFLEKEKTTKKPSRKNNLKRFELALKKTLKQIYKMQRGLYDQLDELARDIFVGHLLILKDEAYVGKIRKKIAAGLMPMTAVYQVTKFHERIFSQSDLPSIREKILDLQDVSQRLSLNLKNIRIRSSKKLANSIALSQELVPSQLLYLAHQKVSAVILSKKSNPESHVSLIAKSLSMPLLSLPAQKITEISEKDFLFLDFEEEQLVKNPSTAWRNSRIKTISKKKRTQPVIFKGEKIPTATLDGSQVEILANINLPQDLDSSIKRGMSVGLYRSEFLFLMRNHFPSEEDQYFFYRMFFDRLKKNEVTIRLLDIGADKISTSGTSLAGVKQSNPLGVRAIRFLFKNEEIFSTQLNAIFRAAYDHPRLKILLPFVSSIEELIRAKEFIANVHRELYKQNIPVALSYKIGVMVEIPSLALMIEDFAKEVDFFSIGTNDMTQLLLAADRNDEEVASIFSLYHPAVLRLVKSIIENANRLHKEVMMCGTMAENLDFSSFLLGCGLRRFSIQPENYLKLHKHIGKIEISSAEKIANDVVRFSTKKEIMNYLQDVRLQPKTQEPKVLKS